MACSFISYKIRFTVPRPSQEFGEQVNKGIYFMGTREQRSKNEGNMGTKAVLGNREHRKSRF